MKVNGRMRSRKVFSRRRRGQALVEFALIVPLLLLLVLGVVEFSRAWQVYQTITDAARDGARTAVLARPSITMDTVVAASNHIMYAARLDTAAAIKTVTGFQVAGGQSTMTISYPYTFRWVSGLMGWTGAQTAFTMNATITFRNEY
jgi:Flp pilus assembly protein TadG